MGNKKRTLPDAAEHATLWRGLSFQERRSFLRAVRRGEAAASRKEARIAVGVARQQQRYWRYAWLIGPAIALALSGRSTSELVISALLGTLAMGAMSVWSYRRAQRSELANLELLGITADK